MMENTKQAYDMKILLINKTATLQYYIIDDTISSLFLRLKAYCGIDYSNFSNSSYGSIDYGD